MARTLIKCPLCNKTFIPKYSRQKFCDSPHMRTCIICGKEFELRKTAEAINQVSCSRKCSMVYRKQSGIQDNVSKKIQDKYSNMSEEEMQKIKDKRAATNIAKYGYANAAQSEEVKQRAKESSLERWGVDNPAKSSIVKERVKATVRERYGVDYVNQAKEIQEKREKTCMERYGTATALESKEIQAKIHETNQKNLGVDYPFQSKLVHEKIDKSNLERYGTIHPMRSEIVKNTVKSHNLAKYGYEHTLQVPEIREKGKQTILEKYGVEYYSQSQECKDKVKATVRERYGVDSVFQDPDFAKKAAQSRARAVNVDGDCMDSSYEVSVYDFCKLAGADIQNTQLPIDFRYNKTNHRTFIDFKIDDVLFEVKGSHLLEGIYDYALDVPINEKLDVYRRYHVVLITDDTEHARNLIGKPNGHLHKNSRTLYSNGLKYIDICPNSLIGIDIKLFDDSIKFPERFSSNKPDTLDTNITVADAFADPTIRWSTIKDLIYNCGGFIDADSVVEYMLENR